jgi:GNAT superfamily N-acetyltransferase
LSVENLNRGVKLQDIEIRGYFPGVLGKITEVHAVYYSEIWGFDLTFETQVARELAEFVSGFDANRDGLWVAIKAGRFAGAIAIDGQHALEEGARLRWFIVVPEFQKIGIGRALIARAIQFCRHKYYPRVYLWTFKGLEDARRLYEADDFELSEEFEVAQWGQLIKEQKYVLQIAHNGEG